MIRLALAEGVELRSAAPGDLAVEHPARGRATLRQLDTGVERALLRLAGGPAPREELAGLAGLATPASERLDAELTRLAGWGMVELRCAAGGSDLLVAALTSELARFGGERSPEGARLRLSRFAHARRAGDDLVVESSRSLARVVVRAPAVAGLLVALARPRTVAELCELAPDLDRAAVAECVELLAVAGVIGVVDDRGRLEEDRDPELAQREFHDVLLHANARYGLTDRPLGGLYPFVGTIPPTPAIKPVDGDRLIPLPRPDLDAVVERDPPLAAVMEARRSVRRYGSRPVTAEQLGELLFRVARVRKVNPVDAERFALYETSDRTYPSGGGTYDLELYLTVRSCEGLAPGIYRYEPVRHALALVCDQPKLVVAMLDHARNSNGQVVPQVLVTMASRFNRLAWKYRGIAYATTLKNVGVLYEALYLAATAMGLAPCALGSGSSAVFARATGLDPLVESSVGEFMLGSLPEE